jgi:hypothetical protein
LSWVGNEREKLGLWAGRLGLGRGWRDEAKGRRGWGWGWDGEVDGHVKQGDGRRFCAVRRG